MGAYLTRYRRWLARDPCSAYVNGYQFISYKAHLAGVVVEKVPAAYTSKSCHHCGALGQRKQHGFVCPRCHYHAHADANAAQNIRDWYGLCCPLVLEAPADGAHGMPLNTVRKTAGCEPVVDQEREPPGVGAGILGLQAEEDVNIVSPPVG